MKAWNKVVLARDEYKKLRSLFFRKAPMNDIVNETGLTQRVIRRIASENKWIEKRNRYWCMLCNMSYRNEDSISCVAKRSGINPSILHRIKRQMGMQTRRFDIHNKVMTPEMESYIVSEYKSGSSSIDLADHFGFATPKTVLDVLKKHKVKRRSKAKVTSYNKRYFNSINSHDKAYILGLLLTDGYVVRDYDGVGIQLSEDDGYLLDRISERLGPSTSVISIDCSSKRKVHPNAKDMIRLTAYCPDMALNLKKFGMVRNKTKILKMPSIRDDFLSSFCRGLWDGDGTIYIDKNNYIHVRLGTASKLFADGLAERVMLHDLSVYGKDFYHVNVCGGRAGVLDFLNWIYSHKRDLYLKRKYERIKDQIS